MLDNISYVAMDTAVQIGVAVGCVISGLLLFGSCVFTAFVVR